MMIFPKRSSSVLSHFESAREVKKHIFESASRISNGAIADDADDSNDTSTSRSGSKFAPRHRATNSGGGGGGYVSKTKIDVGQKESSWFSRNILSGGARGRSNKQSLSLVNDLIKECILAFNNDTKDMDGYFMQVRNRVHEMEFFPFLTPYLIETCKTLREDGLPRIFDSKDSRIFPFDIQADAKALVNRWSNKNYASSAFDIHYSLLRGIEINSGKLANGQKRTSYQIDPKYPFKKPANVFGHNGIVNGQWWPLRVCAIRDGAHGALEAGIYGESGKEKGAYSIVVGAGGYADEDDGEVSPLQNRESRRMLTCRKVIKYCGTQSETAELTRNTKLLVQANTAGQDVRVLRAVNKKSKFAPKKGLRYDGLYKVTGKENLDVATGMMRFTLTRNPGQDPIRYKGSEIRPHAKELDELEAILELKAGRT